MCSTLLAGFLNLFSVAAVLVVATSSADSTHQHNNHRSPPLNTILLMGLPRSGSESIYTFLQCMGMDATHYCCDETTTTTTTDLPRNRFPCADRTCATCLRENILVRHDAPFHGCSTTATMNNHKIASKHHDIVHTAFDEESADPYSWFLPQHFALPLLHNTTGLWILNRRRSAHEWADHVLHWYSVTRRLLHAFGVNYHSTAATTSTVAPTREYTVQELEQAMQVSQLRAENRTEHERRRQALVDIYERHAERVVDFATRYHHPYAVLEIDSATSQATAVQLARLFGFVQKEDLEKAKSCWKLDLKQDDWKDVGLPF